MVFSFPVARHDAGTFSNRSKNVEIDYGMYGNLKKSDEVFVIIGIMHIVREQVMVSFSILDSITLGHGDRADDERKSYAMYED